MTRHPRKPRQQPMHYSMMHELLASDSQPMAERSRKHQLHRMADALHEMMHAERPSNTAWRVLSDAINLTETLVQHGEAPIKDSTGKVVASHWRGCDGSAIEIADTSGLLADAIAAMAKAGARAFDGHAMRLDGPGIAAVRAVLEDYQTALDTLPARTMVRCHRATEKRIREIFNRIDRLPDGVHVMAI